MTDERLRLIAEMRDRLSPQLRRLKTVMESTGRVDAFRKLAKDMTAAERAGYRFGFMMGRTIRYGAIAAAGGAVVAGAAFVKFGKDAADALDENAALAKQIGISGDALRTLQGVAQRYNVTQEGLSAGLTKFNVSFGRLKQNQGAFYTYLKKTNPALASQFKQVGSTGDAFLLLSDAISKTADPAKRAALIKAAGLPQEFLRFFADGPDDLRDTIKQVIALQGLLGPDAFKEAARYGDAMDNIGLAWKGLRDKLAATALPVVNPLLEGLSKFIADNREGIVSGFKVIATDVGAGLQAVGAAFASIDKKQWMDFWTDVKGTASALAALATGINSVVQSSGGWKVVIGGLLALKAGGFAKNLIGGALPSVAVPMPGPRTAPSPGLVATPPAAGSGFLWGILGPIAAAVGSFAALDRLDPQGNLWGLTAGIDEWAKKNLGFDPSKIDASKGRGAFGQRALGLPNPDPFAEDRATRAGADPLSSPFNRSNIAPDALKRANDAAIAFRADPEGTRGRVMLQRSHDEIAAAAKTLIELNAAIAEMQRSGADKKFAEQFADIVARRNAIAANVALGRAADIGKKIGTEAGNSFFDQTMLRFQGISYQGGGGGGGRIWNASYQPGGGSGTGAAVGAAFTGTPGAVPANVAAGADRAMALLQQSGFSSVQAAAIAGNLQQESSFNPNSLNRKEGAHGLMQWRGQRWKNLQKWAGARGLNPNSFMAQIGFIREELTNPAYGEAGKAAARALLGARTIAEANAALKGYIRYGDNSIGTRLRNSDQIHRRNKQQRATGKIEGSASVDIRFPNGVPPGTKVGAQGKGLFREVNLDTGRTMKEAAA